MTEIHVRKVRETETGGQPTPFEEPMKMVMNIGHTGFKEWNTQKKLFNGYDFTSAGKQTEIQLDSIRFSITPNESFLGILDTNEKEDREEAE